MPSEPIDLSDEAALLLLASADMQQAAAAARLLKGLPHGNADSERALETAIAVCYWRPYAEKNRMGRLKEKRWRPDDPDGREIHGRLRRLRNRTYAHTDPGGGRKATASLVVQEELGIATLGLGEQWTGIPREDLDAIIDVCERQATRFQRAAFDAVAASGR